ncbi:MAG: glycosyltransferase N-terminal domain-containing protein, partial [Synergistaceae bacterium]
RDSGFDGPIVLSTTTETGKAMAERLGTGLYDIHIYYPWDRWNFVNSALDAVRPICFVTMETELWPNMLWALDERKIPSFLANGRISDRTWQRLNSRIFGRVGACAYSLFTELFLREERDMERMSKLGIPEEKLFVPGDTKIDALLARRDYNTVSEWREFFGSPQRPIFMSGSTHPGEEEEVMAAFDILRSAVPDARLIAAPRHPERASSVLNLFAGKYDACLLSSCKNGWDVVVVDKIGVLFELYGISKAAFVGGSFADKGGQNILEPVSWGVPVQYGPHMEDFAEASAAFLKLGLAVQLENGSELGKVWTAIASADDAEKFKILSDKYFSKSSGAAKKIWERISSRIDRAR